MVGLIQPNTSGRVFELALAKNLRMMYYDSKSQNWMTSTVLKPRLDSYQVHFCCTHIPSSLFIVTVAFPFRPSFWGLFLTFKDSNQLILENNFLDQCIFFVSLQFDYFICQIQLPKHKGQKFALKKFIFSKSHFWQIHTFKILFFTKFTFLKNHPFHKIHTYETLLFRKSTFF